MAIPAPSNIRRGHAKPYTSLPRIDWSHPLAQGLLFYAYDTGTGTIVDLVTGIKKLTAGVGVAPLNKMSQFGPGLNYTQNGGAIYFPVDARITNASVSDNYSLACGYYLTALPSTPSSCMFGWNDTNGDLINSIISNTSATNDVLWAVGSGAGSGNTGTFTTTANAFHVFVGANTGPTAQNVYQDGVLKLTAALICSNQASLAAQFCFNSSTALSAGAAGDGTAGWVYFGGMWGRTLTAADALQLYNDPYCFLIYPEDELFTTLVGVSAAVPTEALFSNFDPPSPQVGSALDPRTRVSPRNFQDFINAPGNPNQFFGSGHDWWPRAPAPINRSKDWIEFYDATIVGPPSFRSEFQYTQFEPPPKPPRLARDWIEFYDQTIIGPPPFEALFTPFDPPPKPPQHALSWIEFYDVTIVGPPSFRSDFQFTPFDPPPKPPHLARDWIEFYQQTIVGPPAAEALFVRFEPPPKPPRYALDWIAFSGNVYVETLPISSVFTPFDPAPAPRNLDVRRKDFQEFINAPGNPTQFFGSGHDWWPRAPAPHNYARDWIEYNEIGYTTVTPVVINFGGFTPFDPPAKPPRFAQDWIAFYDQTIVGPPPFELFFTPFEPPPKPPRLAKDWIEFYQNTIVGPLGYLSAFSPFDPPPPPPRYAKSWIEFYDQTIVGAPPFEALFTPFDPAPKPPRLAKDWIEFYQQTVVGEPQFESLFTSFDVPPKPPRFAKDWIEFYDATIVGPPSFRSAFQFTPFDPPPRPPQRAKDWIEFFDQTTPNPTPSLSWFSPFDPAPRPQNLARDWVSFAVASIAGTPTFLTPFSPFDPPPKPRNFALDWTAYSENFTFVAPQFARTFSTFDPAPRHPLYSLRGQQPQWWNYDFDFTSKTPPPPARRKQGDWIPKRRRHPTVYDQEYYDQLAEKLRKRRDEDSTVDQVELPFDLPAEKIPNLLIPLDRLISPVELPSLVQAPPRFVPPAEAFALIAREIAAENEMVHAMLMAEIERDRQEIQIQMLEYERLLSKVKGRPSIGNVITLLSDAIDAFDKATHAKKRVIYDADGRPIGIEPILDED